MHGASNEGGSWTPERGGPFDEIGLLYSIHQFEWRVLS